MKGTKPVPAWPLPAATPPTAARPEKKLSRITLALLDEYSEQKNRGYDPYDTRPTGRTMDVWRRKPKRD